MTWNAVKYFSERYAEKIFGCEPLIIFHDTAHVILEGCFIP
jgi:hypothetical protein